MAKQALVRSSDAFIDPPPQQQGLTTDEYLTQVFLWLKKIADKVNGGLTMGAYGTHGLQAGNLNGQILIHTFVSALVAETIPHGLGKKPAYAISLTRNAAGHIFIENHDGWNESEIILKSSAVNLTHHILIW
jgi:hypothetical protein